MPVIIDLGEWNLIIRNPKENEAVVWEVCMSKTIQFPETASPAKIITGLWLHFQDILEEDDWKIVRQEIPAMHKSYAVADRGGP